MKAFALLAAGLGLASAGAHIPRTQVCNGRAEYCDRKYSNVSLIGAHDSGFVGPQTDPRVNQEVDVTAQLTAGIRMVEIQVHLLGDTLSLCHTSCVELYSGTLADYLTKVKNWLDGNPDDVVTVLLANADRVNSSMYEEVFNATGLKKYAYTPPTAPAQLPYDDWPTLGEMISAGTRLVVLEDYNSDMVNYPWILDEYTYYFETPYDTTDPNFNQCTMDRPANTSPDGKMYIVNHFLDTNLLGTGILIPDNVQTARTNAATGNGSIGAQADLCESIYGRPPNVVFVDFFDKGDVFTAQDNLNGVS